MQIKSWTKSPPRYGSKSVYHDSIKRREILKLFSEKSSPAVRHFIFPLKGLDPKILEGMRIGSAYWPPKERGFQDGGSNESELGKRSFLGRGKGLLPETVLSSFLLIFSFLIAEYHTTL